MEGPITIIMASCKGMKDFFMQQTLKEPKFIQFEQGVVKTVYSNVYWKKTCDLAYDNRKAKFIHDKMKIPDKCTLSEDSHKKLHVRPWVSTGTAW